MNFQGVVSNVTDLERSIDFYCDVLGFTLLSRKEQLAAVNAPGSDRAQVLVLRALGSSPMGGARHIGLRAFVLEVDTADQQERIASELEARQRSPQPARDQRVDRRGGSRPGRDGRGRDLAPRGVRDGGGALENPRRLLYGIGE